MNILWVTPDVPFHKNFGGNFDISARIEYVAASGHNIHLVAFAKEPVDESVLRTLNKYCTSTNIIIRPRNPLRISHPKLPYSVSTRYSNALGDIVKTTLQNFGIDVACLESVHVGEILPILKDSGVPSVLRLHNIESYYFQELGKSQKNLILKLVYMWEALKLSKYEKFVYSQCEKILALSLHEIDELKHDHINTYISWLPLSLRLDASTDNDKCDSRPIISFTGSMYLPNNIEAVEWFANEVFPKVLSEVPDAEFWIIGRKPSKAVKKLGDLRNIRVTGEVQNTHCLISGSHLIVVPLFHGAGVKIKILEAIGLGKLVVATSHAIIGTTLEPGQHILVADDPEMFALSCIKALKEPVAFQDMIFKARNYFLDYHAMEVVGKKFLSELACFDTRIKED